MTEPKSESHSYQDMLKEVETIARDIADPNMDLDLLVTKVEKGYTLLGKMRERLTQTKLKIDKLKTGFEQER